MKTSKITTTLAALNLVLFISVSSTAIPFNSNPNDNFNSGVTKQIGVLKSNLSEITSAVISGNEYKYLLFDVAQFDTESGIAELPVNSLERLRFDVNKFSDVTDTEISELPVMNEFDYLRFDVNEFVETDQMTEMPVKEFDYLRFDINEFAGTDQMTEMPVNEFDYLRFDINKLVGTDQITEMPVNEFDYLRFDVNNFDNVSDLSEMPVNEFDYLRFDVNKYSNENAAEIIELPAR